MIRYPEVQNPPPFMVQHQEDPQQPKGHGRHGEEVHPHQTIPMIAQKD
jgi:hypothetical protein